MGAAASLTEAGLPERMNRADLQQICDKKYTEEQFNAICDAEGYITTAQFIEQVVLEQEQECEKLFVSFCRHDEKGRNTEQMDEEHLLGFLRHCKLLSKGGFSVHDARALFHKMIEDAAESSARTQAGDGGEQQVQVVTAMGEHGEMKRVVYVTYRMFREELLPVLAEKKGLPMDRVMFLLSRCEGSTRLVSGELVVTDTYNPSNDSTNNVERSVHLLVNEKEDDEKKKERKLSISSEELARMQATQVIQGAARKRNARKRRKRHMVLRQESMREVDDTCFCSEDYGDLEGKVKDKFHAFAAARSAEMDFKQFHRWLLASGWYIANAKFTKGDAEIVFKKAMARASVLSAGIDLNLGVVMNKRVRYIVFRKVIVKVLAEEINVNTNDIMYNLLDCDDPE